MINYISNLSVNEYSGGWSGMNHFVFEQLKLRYDVHVADEINPPYRMSEKVLSKLARVAGAKGSFPAFTDERLNRIAREVDTQSDKSAMLNFFHGVTPWIKVESPLPYVLYLDACFATYINIYHDAGLFSTKQLNHVFQLESHFLQRAKAVFFSSQWALDDTKSRYNIKGENFHVAGLGGGFKSVPDEKTSVKKYFLFVGHDFIGKGGDVVADVFLQFHQNHPEFTLKIVGQRPPEKFLSHQSINYEGSIDKRNDGGEQKLAELFANAFCLLLPTSRDMTPLVLVEAASVGCPVISTASFGIPEIVINNETGILIDPNGNLSDQLLHAMERMATDAVLYNGMKEKAAAHMAAHFTWERVGERIFAVIDRVMPKEKAYA